jgi:hypothetical protein
MVKSVKEYFDDVDKILVEIFFLVHVHLFTFMFTHSPNSILAYPIS